MEIKERGIVPRRIKGFRDIDANLNQLRWKIINAATQIYKSYGFEHWDTPVLEYAECLGKYLPDEDTVEKGVYSFNNPEIEPVYCGNGDELRDQDNNVVMENHFVSLRYDLTAPLARLYAESLWPNFLNGNLNEGKTPLFRRYQYGRVFRYETKLDPGRFREFWQLDFDTVGTNDVTSDAEICVVLSEALEAIGLKRDTYIVKVNNRKILKGFLISIGIEDENREQDVLRVIDKIDKIGLDGITAELGKGRTDTSGAKIKGIGLDESLVNSIKQFLESFPDTNNRKAVIEKLKQNIQANEFSSEGIEELEKIDEILTSLDVDESRVIFDPTLVRGLAYYTGPVFEVESTQTYIDSKGRERRVGAICAGGRYDSLVKNLLGINVPATGASIGVDRLAELLTLTNQVPASVAGPVLIIVFDDHLMSEYQKIAKELRGAGIKTEVYYGAQRGLKKQMSYADKKNCPIAILLGEDEIAKGVVSVRNLKLGKELASQITDKKEWRQRVQTEVSRDNLVEAISKMIS